ncbi:CST complex subunit CTC1 isoform X2 [Myripristis murdjan]|uniref:CST complex subunit CTC1 isoform X2 n=1 Tax=Myripristis murdjan TaxID=586833 RepID=UPI001175E384|nr:CST complex subunit CTC1 isoform X2 [Myripristis murdjan]
MAARAAELRVPCGTCGDMQPFLDQFPGRSDAECVWLKELHGFVTDHLCPLLSGSTPPGTDGGRPGAAGCASQLSVCVVRRVEEMMAAVTKHTLPVSYRLVSVSELVTRQHVACVSNLSWNTNQHRAWVREAELALPNHKALPRVNLLLIGCLREGRDGEWRLTDARGSVRCECLSPSPQWLNWPLFFPHWNYIPQNATGRSQEEPGGHVELIGSPLPLSPAPGQGLAVGPGGAGLSRAVGVEEAAAVLHTRPRGVRLSVRGLVCSVCPLLVVADTAFFCFRLTDDTHTHTVPVLVKDRGRLWWRQCVSVCVGQSVCVTALRVCVLHGWRGNSVLCVTDRSTLHTHTQEHTHTPGDGEHTHTQEHTHTPGEDTHTDTQSDLSLSLRDNDPEEAEPETDAVQSAVRMKQSKVISYQGVVTEVLSEGAGLYVIDGTVGLCVSYQPQLRRKLRAGDAVELHHVHFLYRPCPDFTPSMLCACLRSSLRLTAFSRVTGSEVNPEDGLLPRLLLERNVGVAEYLWVCHVTRRLRHSLVPSLLKEECVCVLAWKLMECVWRGGGGGGGGRRDIYSEMLDELHTCPVTQYSSNPAVCECVCVGECVCALQAECWSGVCLSSLLPPGGSSLSRAQVNAALAWSHRVQRHPVTSDPHPVHRRRPLLLVGVLELPSHTPTHTSEHTPTHTSEHTPTHTSEHTPTHTSEHTLQLRDQTGAVACVVTETSEEEEAGQRPAFNTAWIGCLVCIQRFTMVTERFLQSDFPSYQHLDQDKYITHKSCRVYLQFSLDDVHILSPSITMVTHLRGREEEESESVAGRRKDREEEEEEEEEEEPLPPRKKRKMEEGGADKTTPGSSQATSFIATATGLPGDQPLQACVSVVIRVEGKEGVAWRNTGSGSEDEEAGLSLCFSATAAVIGPVVQWGRDPKNRHMMDRETEEEKDDKVLLLFSGVSVRWFPLLHPGVFYRLVAPSSQDPSVLIGCSVAGRSGVELRTNPSLQVRSAWRFHTLTRPLLLPAPRQARSPAVMCVSDVLDCSSVDLVCFQGLVSHRISVSSKLSSAGHTNTGVRLTVCDQSGRSLQVYLDLSHTPYPPGLLPGNTLLLSNVQRRLSRSGSVYCSSLPVSSITVTSLGDTSPAQPPAPMMHLGGWALGREQRCTVGRVRGHVVCFLFLRLQWSCSLCEAVYTQAGCSSSQCDSTSSVFQAKARVVLDDGTGEAHVWFSCPLVRPLLRLAESQWEGLQRALRVRGHLRLYTQGRSLVCDDSSDDPLLHFLLCVCSSDAVCRPLSLTCRMHTHTQQPEEVRRFSRGDRQFMTRMIPPLQLTCLHMETG